MFSTIRAKMYWLMLIILLSISLILYKHYQLNKNTLELELAITYLVQTESDIYQMRRHEKNFLSRKDLQAIEQLKQTDGEISTRLEKLKVITDKYGFNSQQILTLATQKADYIKSFEYIVKQQSEIGFNENSGIRGQLRASVQEVERLMNDLNKDTLSKGILMLRRNEKDFLLRLDMKYVSQFEQNIQMLKQHLAQELQSQQPATYQQALALVNQYQQGFGLAVSKYQIMGLTPNDGARGEMRQDVAASEKALKELTSSLQQFIKHELESQAQQTWVITLMIIAALLVIVLMLQHVILKSIHRLQGDINKFAQDNGNLTMRLYDQSKDELADVAKVFNNFMGSIQQTIAQVNQASTQLATSSTQSLTSAQVTQSNIAEINQEVSSISTAMHQMTASVQAVSQTTAEAQNLAASAQTETENGHQVVGQAIETIELLASDIQLASERIGLLSEQSSNIGNVLLVIQGIAEQTNLLALNAAIEAARAGEQGRGFAVVADEVRGLAQRTHSSVQDIETMIEELQQGVRDSVTVMETSHEKTQESVQRVADIKAALDSISNTVSQVNDMNQVIATATHEKQAVSEDMNKNLYAIAERVQQTSDESQQILDSSQGLSNLSQEMFAQMQRFKV